MIRHTIAASLALLLAGSARADVLYQFVPTSYGGNWSYDHGGISLSLDLAEPASAFSVVQQQYPFWLTGGTGLQAFSATAPRLTAFYGAGGGFMSANLTFGTGGTLLADSFNITNNGDDEQLHVTGTTALFRTDDEHDPCYYSACTATGRWTETPVPEPATLALLGTGLFLFGAFRSRG